MMESTWDEEASMDIGFFTMPSHPPERGLREGHEWDLQVIRWADELGMTEGWIGEHHTAPWEPHPSPDLLVVQGFSETERIRLGPGGFLPAVSPPGRAREPRRDARPHLRRAAQLRRGSQRPAERLGPLQRQGRHRREPRHDPGGSRSHPEALVGRG